MSLKSPSRVSPETTKPLRNMSAPKAGRQSPEPDRQANEQITESVSGNVGAAESDTKAQEVSEDQKANVLSSNPDGPLEGAAHEKVSKEGRGDT